MSDSEMMTAMLIVLLQIPSHDSVPSVNANPTNKTL